MTFERDTINWAYNSSVRDSYKISQFHLVNSVNYEMKNDLNIIVKKL